MDILWEDLRAGLTLWEVVGGWYGYEGAELGTHKRRWRRQLRVGKKPAQWSVTQWPEWTSKASGCLPQLDPMPTRMWMWRSLECSAKVERKLLEIRCQAKTARRSQIASVRVDGWTPMTEHQYVQGETEYVGSSGLNSN